MQSRKARPRDCRDVSKYHTRPKRSLTHTVTLFGDDDVATEDVVIEQLLRHLCCWPTRWRRSSLLFQRCKVLLRNKHGQVLQKKEGFGKEEKGKEEKGKEEKGKEEKGKEEKGKEEKGKEEKKQETAALARAGSAQMFLLHAALFK